MALIVWELEIVLMRQLHVSCLTKLLLLSCFWDYWVRMFCFLWNLRWISSFPCKPGSQISDYNVEDVNKQNFYDRNAVNSPEWTDLFVHEMTSAMNIDDAKARAARILEAFERRVVANKRAAEEVILKSFYFVIKLFSGNQLVCCLPPFICWLVFCRTWS